MDLRAEDGGVVAPREPSSTSNDEEKINPAQCACPSQLFPLSPGSAARMSLLRTTRALVACASQVPSDLRSPRDPRPARARQSDRAADTATDAGTSGTAVLGRATAVIRESLRLGISLRRRVSCGDGCQRSDGIVNAGLAIGVGSPVGDALERDALASFAVGGVTSDKIGFNDFKFAIPNGKCDNTNNRKQLKNKQISFKRN